MPYRVIAGIAAGLLLAGSFLGCLAERGSYRRCVRNSLHAGVSYILFVGVMFLAGWIVVTASRRLRRGDYASGLHVAACVAAWFVLTTALGLLLLWLGFDPPPGPSEFD